MRLNACLGGRPDVMKLIKKAYYSWGAEVVFITSNLQGNTEMMEGCKEAGIPAFVSNFICVVFLDHVVILLGYLVGFLNKRKTSSVFTSENTVCYK